MSVFEIIRVRHQFHVDVAREVRLPVAGDARRANQAEEDHREHSRLRSMA